MSGLLLVHCIKYCYFKQTSVIVIGGERSKHKRLQNRNQKFNYKNLTREEYVEV